MSQIFISYRRKDFWFVERLRKELDQALDTNIFVDLFGIHTPEYANEILGNLRNSDLVLLVLSDFTFNANLINNNDDWIRREMRETLTYNKPLYLLRLMETPFPNRFFLPADIADCAERLGIQFQPESFPEDFDRLVKQIVETPGLNFQRRVPPIPQPHINAQPTSSIDFRSALDLIENKKYLEAIAVLRQLLAQDEGPSGFFDLNDLINKLQYQHDFESERLKAKREYDIISAWLKIGDMEKAFELWKVWLNTYQAYVEELDVDEYKMFLVADEQVNQEPYHSVKHKTPEAITKAIEFSGIYNNEWRPHLATLEHSRIQDIEYCLVPAGSFLMGSEEGVLDETPVQEPFWVMKTPVTNAHWRMAVKDKFVNEPTTNLGYKWFHDHSMSNCPVVGIPWEQARRFAYWLGGELLTEEEWEYITRGIESWRYPWGNQFDPTKVYYKYNSSNSPRTVDATDIGSASWVGATDLIGNISEWLSSKYLPYPTQNHNEANIGNSVSIRGGSWRSDQIQLKASHRNLCGPLISLDTLGLRCKLPIKPSEG